MAKVKPHFGPIGQYGRSLIQFCRMKHLRASQLLPGWDPSPLQGYNKYLFVGAFYIPGACFLKLPKTFYATPTPSLWKKLSDIEVVFLAWDVSESFKKQALD